MTDIDRTIHEPVRLRILAILSGVDLADFKFFVTTLGLSKGNLSSHMDKLEQAGYVEVQKGFNGKIPRTAYRMTDAGRKALADYWIALDQIRTACTEADGPTPS
ncbi:MAG: transcriptional regulator [Pirellulales bacterium]|nr:transcriptional regulator [Pirellulales bacterium]